jgi:hypothetical protein
MDLAHGRGTLYVRQAGSQHVSRGFGVDFFDIKETVQACARQRYGWRGNDDDNIDQDTESILVSAAQTPPSQKTQPQIPVVRCTLRISRVAVVAAVAVVVMLAITSAAPVAMPARMLQDEGASDGGATRIL